MGCARSSPAFNYYTRIKPHMTVLPRSPTVKGFTANNQRGSLQYLRRRLERRIVCGSAATACSTDRSMDGAVCAAARRVVRGGPGGVPDGSLMSPRRSIRIETGPAACPAARLCVASADGADRDGPGILPDGSLVSLAGIASATAKRLARQLRYR